MNWKPAFAIVLMGVTLITFWGGYLLDRQDINNHGLLSGSGSIAERDDNRVASVRSLVLKRKKRLVWCFGLMGLLPLLVFKYYGFINNSISAVLESIGLHFEMTGLNWMVPVGISFFTFQAVGYLLDVYHGRVKAEKSLLDYMLFVSFFPQVTSGPISTAEELLPQIKVVHTFDYEQGKQGLKQILWGMFLKLVIADRLGLFVDTVYANYVHFNGATCFVASLFFSFQIYSDFAGYTLMAIGIARTLGFNLADNFHRPYLAISITDFWKRWHITLTRWLTRQVYIPLGGSRCNKARTYWNILVTFLVSGIWHGANWTFIFWGVFHGALQIVEKAIGWQKYEGKNIGVHVLRIVVTFLLVNIAWVFFRMPSIGEAFDLLWRMVTVSGAPTLSLLQGSEWFMLMTGILLLVFKDLRDECFANRFKWLQKPVVRWAGYVLLFCMILNFGIFDGGSFIYVSF